MKSWNLRKGFPDLLMVSVDVSGAIILWCQQFSRSHYFRNNKHHTSNFKKIKEETKNRAIDVTTHYVGSLWASFNITSVNRLTMVEENGATLSGTYRIVGTILFGSGRYIIQNACTYPSLERFNPSLVRHLALPVHISSSNGLMDMIGSGKVFTDVLAMCFNT